MSRPSGPPTTTTGPRGPGGGRRRRGHRRGPGRHRTRRPGSSTSTWATTRGGTRSSPTTPRATGRHPPSWGPALRESGGEVRASGVDRLAAPLGLLPVLLAAERGEVEEVVRPAGRLQPAGVLRVGVEDAPVDL